MSKTSHHGARRITVKGIRRNPVDLRRLARALIELARAEAEAAAQADHEQIDKKAPTTRHSGAKPHPSDQGGPEAA